MLNLLILVTSCLKQVECQTLYVPQVDFAFEINRFFLEREHFWKFASFIPQHSGCERVNLYI